MAPVKLRLIVVFLFAAGMVVAETEPVITKAMALKAATLFRNADPFSEDARGCAAILMRFTDKSPDVLVGIARKAVPFLGDKELSDQMRGILLGAFVAGNVDSQLLRGRKKDDPYAGNLQVIDTYQKMRKNKPRLSIPAIEKLINLEAAGKLQAYLASE